MILRWLLPSIVNHRNPRRVGFNGKRQNLLSLYRKVEIEHLPSCILRRCKQSRNQNVHEIVPNKLVENSRLKVFRSMLVIVVLWGKSSKKWQQCSKETMIVKTSLL